MTQKRHIERLLDEWFSDGPTIVPDRVIDTVADRLERQNQRPSWRFGWPQDERRHLVRIVAAVAAVILIAVVGYSLLPRSSNSVVGPPSPAPSPAATSPATSPSPTASPGPKAAIRVGSDGFAESRLIAELYGQALAASGYPVIRVPTFASRGERETAFNAGVVDLVPEYVGWNLGYDAKATISNDGSLETHALQNLYDTLGNLAFVLSVTPGADTPSGIVRKDLAASFGLTRMSDLAAIQDQLRWGLPADCNANRLCSGALMSYGIAFPPNQVQRLAACDPSTAQAIQDKAIDFAWLCSTQSAIAQFGLAVLVDDRQIQPPGYVSPVVRNDYLAKYPALVDRNDFLFVLDSVSAGLTTDELTKLGVKVGVNHEAIPDVARQWLADQGLPRAFPR